MENDEYFSSPSERRYDPQSDRLFLVYYPVVSGFNANKWGVSEGSIPNNIQTAINKPVVICRKDSNNRFHTHQAGNFVHPTLDEATAELGHSPKAEEYFNWQEKFAVGRVRNVEKRNKGYAFTLEITDPEAKNILKSDTYRKGIPGWTSPQIISDAFRYPQEERSATYDHWTVSHIALVDVPAYGFQQAGIRGKCLGAEKECTIKTRSASQENLGFCVKQATIDLIESRSSHVDSISNPPHNIMSQSESTAPTKSSAETVTYSTNAPGITKASDSQPEPQPEPQPQPEPNPEPQPQPEQLPPPPSTVKTLEEANNLIQRLYNEKKASDERIAAMAKDNKTLMKWKAEIEAQNRFLTVKNIVPPDLFKTAEAHKKEVERIINSNLDADLDWLVDHYKLMRDAMKAKHFTEEHPILAKSASVEKQQQQQHDVPDYGSSQNQNVRSNVQKQLELQRMILEGAA